MFWQIPYRYNRVTCGKWKFSTTHGEKRKKRLWSPVWFPHLWDRIYWITMILGLQRHVLVWNAVPDSTAAYRNLLSCPFGCSKKHEKHEPLQRARVSARASFPFLRAQSGCLKLIICRCILTACSRMPISLLQV